MRRPRPHHRLQRVLLADIAAGSPAAGKRLPREQDLAQQFGVSKALVREAVRGLEERGVVRVRQGHGTVVRAPGDWNLLDEDVLAAMLQTRARTEILREFLEARRLIEVEAAGLAAERATAEDLGELTNAIVQMAAAAQRAHRGPAAQDLFHDADVEFHCGIVHAAGNRILARVVEPMQSALRDAQRPLVRPQERLTGSLGEHKAILTAIARHDAVAARAAMSGHLESVERHLRELLSQDGIAEGRPLT